MQNLNSLFHFFSPQSWKFIIVNSILNFISSPTLYDNESDKNSIQIFNSTVVKILVKRYKILIVWSVVRMEIKSEQNWNILKMKIWINNQVAYESFRACEIKTF